MPDDQVRRPEVTLTSSSSTAVPTTAPQDEPEPGRRRPWALLLLPLALVALVLTRPPPPPAPPPQPAPELVQLADEVFVTQGGVLVVAVALRNPGDALRVRSATAYAEPVREDPVVQAPEAVRAGTDRRFVALLAPDCRMLQPASPLRFSASLMLEVAQGAQERQLVLDLGRSPTVVERVAGLCRQS